MANQEEEKDKAIAWAKRQLENGSSIDDIKEALVKKEYKEEHIAKILSDLKSEEEVLKAGEKPGEPEEIKIKGALIEKRKKIFSNKRILIPAAIVFIIIIGILIIMFTHEPKLGDTLLEDEKIIGDKFVKDSKIIKQRIAELTNECINNNLLDPGCISVATKNSSYCQQIKGESEKIDCLAYITENISYCYRHNDSDEINQCIGTISHDSSYCKKIKDDDYKFDCLATAEQNSKYCYEITDTTDKYECLALIESNVSYCENINNPSEISKCKVEVLNNPEVCKESQSSFCEGWAIQKVAMENNEPRYCENLQDESSKTKCYSSFDISS